MRISECFLRKAITIPQNGFEHYPQAALIDYAQPIVNELRANMVRVDSDFSATPLKAKIADAW